ncbi:hypothetical protein DB347_17935 [Opitutaceae bacterium EW11]|nr:hypothetical protein DB347_17935 [Opitutaceae bacterium EW11]
MSTELETAKKTAAENAQEFRETVMRTAPRECLEMIQRKEIIFDDLTIFQQALLKAEALDYKALTEGERQKLQDLISGVSALVSSFKEAALLQSATQAQSVESSQESLAQILREHLQEIRLAQAAHVETLKAATREQLKLFAEVVVAELRKAPSSPPLTAAPVVPVMVPPAPLASEKHQTESDLPNRPTETPVAVPPKKQSWFLPATIGCLLGVAAAVAAMVALKGAL